jgi:hypothetical protein
MSLRLASVSEQRQAKLQREHQRRLAALKRSFGESNERKQADLRGFGKRTGPAKLNQSTNRLRS